MHALLIATGKALYGQQWQSALARDLGVSDRTMRRWAAGEQAAPVTVAEDLRRLVIARRAELTALAKQLA